MLEIEIFHVDTMVGEIGVKLGLLRELALADFLAPEGMLAKMLPVDTFHRVFL